MSTIKRAFSVDKACIACSKRKIKCTYTIHPKGRICDHCAKKGIECLVPPKKKKLSKDSRVNKVDPHTIFYHPSCPISLETFINLSNATKKPIFSYVLTGGEESALNENRSSYGVSQYSSSIDLVTWDNSYGGDLISIYFELIHPKNPILVEKDFLQSYKEKKVLPQLLLAIFTHAAMHNSRWPLEERSRMREVFFNHLVEKYPWHSSLPCYDLVLALVITSNAILDRRVLSIVSTCVYMAHELRLFCSPVEDCSSLFKSQRKIIAWAIFNLAAWSAVRYTYRSAIKIDEMEISMVTAKDVILILSGGENEGSPAERQATAHTFIFNCRLSRIVSEIFHSFYWRKNFSEFELNLLKLENTLDDYEAILNNLDTSMTGSSNEEVAGRFLLSVCKLVLYCRTMPGQSRIDLSKYYDRSIANLFVSGERFKKLVQIDARDFWYPWVIHMAQFLFLIAQDAKTIVGSEPVKKFYQELLKTMNSYPSWVESSVYSSMIDYMIEEEKSSADDTNYTINATPILETLDDFSWIEQATTAFYIPI